MWLTWLVDSAKGVPGVVLAGLKAVFTEVKVVTVSAFKPGAVDGEHLAAITPADAVACIEKNNIPPCDFSGKSRVNRYFLT